MNEENSGAPKILIIDDNPANLSLLFSHLDQKGFKILVAQSGESAIEEIAHEPPDIILLDILMPGMDGFETCRRLKADETTCDIPVLFMTALSNKEDKIAGFKAGGVDFITKPFQQEEVLARINTHLMLQRQRCELAALNDMKDAFFSIIARDMRNALVPMIGLSDLLSVETLSVNNVHQIAKQMDGYVKQAYKLLENLVTLASIYNHTIEFHPDILDLHDIVLENKNLFRGIARRKQIQLLDTVNPCTCAYADRHMVHLIVRNLLSNSMKFTPSEGTVRVSACDDNKKIVVSVSDTGIGIKADALPKILRIDKKYRTPGTDGETGSGLGLLLCEELVKQNQGELSIRSTPQQGTTVTFSLPKPHSET